MHHWRVSKKQVFPIIITLLVQFHLPHVSLLSASAQGAETGAVLRIAADFTRDRVAPYRTESLLQRGVRHEARLIRSGKAIARNISNRERIRTTRLLITAYSSTKDQTDSTPCITANGFNVCKHNQENVIAANFLPMGAKVQIPELFGDRVFTVQDRMNRRYGKRVDVWMTSRQRAKQFGIKHADVVVIQPERTTIPPTTQIAGNF